MPLNPPLSLSSGHRAWIIGASTGIGRALAEQLHRQGVHVIVSARSADALSAFAAQHSGSLALPLDTTDRAAMHAAAQRALADGPLDLVVYCAGHYQAMRATALDLPQLLRHHEVNTVGVLYLLDAIVPSLLARGAGHLSLISSVAGYRGLPQSLAYGPTKAALINLAETLYLDLRPHGIGVSLVNPGFVDTPLTANNAFPMPALITPDQAARAMIDGWARGQFELHFPKRFTSIMKLLRHLPYSLYFAAIRRFTGLS